MEVSYRCGPPIVEREREASFSGFLIASGGGRLLQLVGELDLAGAQAVRARLADVDGDVEVDCSRLTFIDCSGLRVLQDAQRACETEGVQFCLVAPSPCVTKLVELLGLDGWFEIRDGPKW